MDDIAMGEYVNTPYNAKFGGVMNYFQVGGKKALTHRDSVEHQVDKILKYEIARGGAGPSGLAHYADPAYKKLYMEKVYPEVSKILPKATAMEKGEAIDFVTNAGWDKVNNKISLDPRGYALQEYYRKYEPEKLDSNGKWSGRKGAPYSFDDEYNRTIGKLSENERRIFMNKGRDWYYQNTAPAGSTWDLKTQGPHPNYEDTWYGRIWNTNDFSEFDPYNPKFFRPKKEYGGEMQEFKGGGEMIKRADGSYSRRGLWDNNSEWEIIEY
jgi:hypothetical protein